MSTGVGEPDSDGAERYAVVAGGHRLMASRADLCTAAGLQAELNRQYAGLERRIGHTLSKPGAPLPELTANTVPQLARSFVPPAPA